MSEHRSKRRAASKRTPTSTAGGDRGGGPGLGNAALGGMIAQLRGSEASAAAGGPVPWEHPTFEREAGAVAAKAKGRAVPPDARGELAGAPLAADHAAALEPLVGRDVGRVRLHTDAGSQSAAGAMGAHAFTSGNDIHFGPGEYDPSSPQGFELLAHEVTHAVQHPTGHDHAGNELVHAKLAGSRKAMEDLGGKKSKSLRKRALGSNWNELLSQLGTYEKLEAAYTAAMGKKTDDAKLAAQREKLLKALEKLEKVALQWQQANDQEEAERIKKQALTSLEPPKEDTREKAPRRQAVSLFLTRVRVERGDLQRGGTVGTGFDDSNLAWGKDDAVGGGMNRLDQIAYTGDDGEIFEGYFKEDKGFTAKMAGHDTDVGIAQHDSNWGARSVAMYRLDKLLQGGVIARTEFAVHTSRSRKSETRTPGESNLNESATKLGFVTEKAKGDAMSDLTSKGGLTMQMGEDPVLQSCMNKLQILDVIAGQLDRHGGNFFVERDPETGKVLGVTGIDNDMAFGENMLTPDDSKGAHNYVPMPELIDEEFGRRLLKITEQDIRDTLDGLLTNSEIDATVSRFNIVRDAVKNLDDKGELTRDWDKAALDKQVGDSATFKKDFKREERSILARELAGAFKHVTDFRAPLYKSLVAAKLVRSDIDLIFTVLRELVMAREVDIDEVEAITRRTLADIERFVDKRGEDEFPELGRDWIETYVEGARRGI